MTKITNNFHIYLDWNSRSRGPGGNEAGVRHNTNRNQRTPNRHPLEGQTPRIFGPFFLGRLSFTKSSGKLVPNATNEFGANAPVTPTKSPEIGATFLQRTDISINIDSDPDRIEASNSEGEHRSITAPSLTESFKNLKMQEDKTPAPASVFVEAKPVLEEYFISNTTKVPAELHQTLREKLGEAADKLRTGPLILGESHTKPGARAVLLDLIRNGYAKKLFLELASLPRELFGDPEYQHSREGNISDHLRATARERSTLDDDADWNEAKTFLESEAFLDSKSDNKIGMAEIIETAVLNGVEPFWIDNGITKNPTSDRGMAIRNQAAGKEFKAKGGQAIGSVLLIGADHTKVLQSVSRGDETIQHHAGVDPDRVMDLSN